MNISMDFTFSPADKQVWLLKLIATLVAIIAFIINYYFIGGTYDVGAAVGAAVIAAALLFIFGTTNEKKYKISLASNLISGLIQIGLTWLGFYIAQHLQIHLSFSWM